MSEKEEVSNAVPIKNKRVKAPELLHYYSEDPNIIEICVDEVGRGPLLGAVYTCAVILPKENTEFKYSLMKDSKKFSSKKKMEEVANYLKENSIYHVACESEKVIDEINILRATQQSMHKCITEVIKNNKININNVVLLIDGNYFSPLCLFNSDKKMLQQVKHVCIEKGDNTYAGIAAASILAKTTRDNYIKDLCSEKPLLSLHYGIDKNCGYGTSAHLAGIKKYGITELHRKSFGICKTYA
jgi:ribonuclease HII